MCVIKNLWGSTYNFLAQFCLNRKISYNSTRDPSSGCFEKKIHPDKQAFRVINLDETVKGNCSYPPNWQDRRCGIWSQTFPGSGLIDSYIHTTGLKLTLLGMGSTQHGRVFPEYIIYIPCQIYIFTTAYLKKKCLQSFTRILDCYGSFFSMS